MATFQEQFTENATVSAINFTTTYTPVVDTLQVFIEGIFQTRPHTYNITGKQITFTGPVPAGYKVVATYQYLEGGPSPDSFQSASTYLNNATNNYPTLAYRLKRQLGYPIIEIELCDEQLYEFINQAVEFYSKYAGYTEEFLVLDSSKYPCGRGFDMEEILRTVSLGYACKGDFSLSGNYIDEFLNNDIRKVVNIFSFDQAEFTGTDALFTLEYVYAQQIYYSYMLGSYGFDLITWETLKQFLDTRKKMFSSIPRVLFDNRTQRMRIIPEPSPSNPYIGIIGVYLERRVQDMLKERWVQQYSLALSKIALGHIRGKYGGVSLFGGGSIQGGDLTAQGLAERDKLEEEMLKGFGEVPPPLMFIG